MNEINCASSSLEEEFEAYAFGKVGTSKNTNFDYLVPNEGSPEGIQPHLALAKRGLLVSTGTERSFFDLLFSDETKCEGLVIVDITWRVHWYATCNTMLLRISEDREEYAELSEYIKGDESLKERISLILLKLENCDMPAKVRKYYLDNLNDFAPIYLTASKSWRHGIRDQYFLKCRYDQDDAYFLKLQRYAKSGNIISTVRNINDLTFLKGRNVSVVDTSNIHDYCTLNIQGEGDFHPRVIWTLCNMRQTTYNSYQHEPLNIAEKNELDGLIYSVSIPFSYKFGVSDLDLVSRRFYSVKLLNIFREHFKESMLEIPGPRVVRIPEIEEIDKSSVFELNHLKPEQINELCENENVKRFAARLVECWKVLKPSVYLAFSQVEGWKDAFVKCFFWTPLFLEDFLWKLDKCGLLDKFTQDFGGERLEALKNGRLPEDLHFSH